MQGSLTFALVHALLVYWTQFAVPEWDSLQWVVAGACVHKRTGKLQASYRQVAGMRKASAQ